MKLLTRLILLSVPLLLLSCDERLQQTDSGGVLLEIDLGNNLPLRESVNTLVATDSLVNFPTINFVSVVADPRAPSTSSLMDIQLESLEVTYERVDGGTRLPPPYVVKILGTVPVGGSLNIANLEVMSFDQIAVPPLSDLLFENGGFDKETGLTYVRMNLYLRAYGRTIGDRPVSSLSRPHTMEFTQ